MTADTKTLKSRRAVNLPEPVVELLTRHHDQQEKERVDLGPAWVETGFVFTSSIGTPIDPRNLYRDFQKVCENAGLSHWHPHELRHLASSLMLNRPGFSGGSPAWERGWNHGQEAGWTDEVSV